MTRPLQIPLADGFVLVIGQEPGMKNPPPEPVSQRERKTAQQLSKRVDDV